MLTAVPQRELGWRLRAVYDRREVHEVLVFLEQEGLLRKRGEMAAAFSPPDEDEEKTTFWLLGDRRWFQL